MNFIDAITKQVRKFTDLMAVYLDKASKGKITPDMVTWVGFLAHLPIAYLIAQDYLIISAVFLIIFGLFDALDGGLARLQKVASPAGMVLDATTDRLKQMLIFAAISYNFLVNNYSNLEIILPIIALGVSITGAYFKAKTEAAVAVSKKQADHHKLNRMMTDGLLQFEVLISLIILGLFVDQLLLACWIITILMSLSITSRLIRVRKIIDGLV